MFPLHYNHWSLTLPLTSVSFYLFLCLVLFFNHRPGECGPNSGVVTNGSYFLPLFSFSSSWSLWWQSPCHSLHHPLTQPGGRPGPWVLRGSSGPGTGLWRPFQLLASSSHSLTCTAGAWEAAVEERHLNILCHLNLSGTLLAMTKTASKRDVALTYKEINTKAKALPPREKSWQAPASQPVITVPIQSL